MLINLKFATYLIFFSFLIPPAFAESKGNDGVISELRIGLSAHDVGPFSRKEESGKNVNFEVLFVSPKFLKKLKNPKPHLGVNINSENDTNQAYAGLTWEWPIGKSWFFDFSLGARKKPTELTARN